MTTRTEYTIPPEFAAFAAATNNDIYDAELTLGQPWLVEAVETHETLEQFEESSRGWAERSAVKRGEVAGLPYIYWRQAQARRGMRRRPMWVVDFGAVRYALDAYADDYI